MFIHNACQAFVPSPDTSPENHHHGHLPISTLTHSAYSESVRRRRVRGGTGRARPVHPAAGPKRHAVDRSTSRSQNDFNLHDFPLHAVASRGLWHRAVSPQHLASSGPSARRQVSGPSAKRSVARSFCTTWRCAVSLHHVASRGLSARSSVARSLCTTWRRAVSLHALASRGPSARRSYVRSLHAIASRGFSVRCCVARSLCTTWRRAIVVLVG